MGRIDWMCLFFFHFLSIPFYRAFDLLIAVRDITIFSTNITKRASKINDQL